MLNLLGCEVRREWKGQIKTIAQVEDEISLQFNSKTNSFNQWIKILKIDRITSKILCFPRSRKRFLWNMLLCYFTEIKVLEFSFCGSMVNLFTMNLTIRKMDSSAKFCSKEGWNFTMFLRNIWKFSPFFFKLIVNYISTLTVRRATWLLCLKVKNVGIKRFSI